MDIQFIIKNQMLFDRYSTNYIVDNYQSPLRMYSDEFIEGPIIDIGCGLSDDSVYYANLDRKFYAIDKFEEPLKLLKKRICQRKGANINNWEFLTVDFPKENVPDNKYALVILSNILHFFTEEEHKLIGHIIDDITVKGSMIYTLCHSTKHRLANMPKDFFKSFFDENSFKNIFPEEKYERLYIADKQYKHSKEEEDFNSNYLDIMAKTCKVSDIDSFKKANTDNNNMTNQIEVIFRKI